MQEFSLKQNILSIKKHYYIANILRIFNYQNKFIKCLLPYLFMSFIKIIFLETL